MTDIVGNLKTGRVVVRPVQVAEREKTKTEYQLILDGHVLGQSKGVTDALYHGYALETSLAAQGQPEKRVPSCICSGYHDDNWVNPACPFHNPVGQPEKESGR